MTLIIGTALALGICAIPGVTQQQQAQQQPLPTRVAVIDLEQVIKAHPEFIQRQEALQKQVLEVQKGFEQQRVAITDKQKNLEASPHRPGTAEHQRILDEIANDIAEFEKNLKTQERRFGLQNSQIMFDTFKNIKETIAKIAVPYGIAQVTDYREIEPNPADPNTVAADMDQRLVWFNESLNITRAVINQLYQDRGMTPPAPQASGTNASPARTATVPSPGVQMQR